MMPAKKKKPDLALVIGFGKKKHAPEEEPDEHEEEGGDDEEAEHNAVAALGEAIHAKDWKRAAEAFKVLHRLCQDSYGDGEEDGEEGGEE